MTHRSMLRSLLLAAILLAPASARAYVSFTSPSGAPARWPTANIEWYLDPAGSDDISFDRLQAVLEQAFNTWSSPACSALTFRYSGQSPASVPGAMYVRFDEVVWNDLAGEALAYAQPRFSNSGVMDHATLVFNGRDYTWTDIAVTGEGNLRDVQAVATHEIGHALGLGHSQDREATMFFVGGGMVERSIENDDVQGICFLYPAAIFDSGDPCDSCTLDEHCAVGACVQHPWEGGAYCAQDCVHDSHCPLGYRCQQTPSGGQCMSAYDYCQQDGANIPFGEYCWGHANCQSRLCLTWGNTAFCSQICTPGVEGSCPHPGVCRMTMDGRGICDVPDCDPVTDTGCDVGRSCIWYRSPSSTPGTDAVAGRCVPDIPGGARATEACGPDTIGCQPGLECRPAPDGSGSFCRQDCRKAGPTTGCPVGQRCVDEGDSANPERGSCEPAPATTTIPPPVSGPGTTTTPDEGSAPAAPDVVSTPRVDARGEADADATDEGGGGCHLAPTGGSIPWPLVFSALAALAVVRRRL